LLQVPPDPPTPGRRPGAHDASVVRPAEASCDGRLHEGGREYAGQSLRRVSAPVPLMQSAEASAKLDGFVETETDQADMMRQFPQLKGQFLIDRDGIVRWANIECATEGLPGIGKFPSEEEILAAARAMLRR